MFESGVSFVFSYPESQANDRQIGAAAQCSYRDDRRATSASAVRNRSCMMEQIRIRLQQEFIRQPYELQYIRTTVVRIRQPSLWLQYDCLTLFVRSSYELAAHLMFRRYTDFCVGRRILIASSDNRQKHIFDRIGNYFSTVKIARCSIERSAAGSSNIGNVHPLTPCSVSANVKGLVLVVQSTSEVVARHAHDSNINVYGSAATFARKLQYMYSIDSLGTCEFVRCLSTVIQIRTVLVRSTLRL